MTPPAKTLPPGCHIRPLRLTDGDRLRLYTMPNNPGQVLPFLSRKTLLNLYKIGHGITLAILPGIGLYVVIGMLAIRNSSIDWFLFGISGCILLGICITLAFNLREDWLKYCWVVEEKERFVAYGILRPYEHYSRLDYLQVHPQWSRKGIGSALVKTMISQAPKPVFVESAVRVVGFYDRLGFRNIKFKELPPDLQKQFQLRGIATLMVYQ